MVELCFFGVSLRKSWWSDHNKKERGESCPPSKARKRVRSCKCMDPQHRFSFGFGNYFRSLFLLYCLFIMPHAFGYRAHTRTLFKKAFKTNGRCPTTTYLRTFKRGDYVDIKVDSSVHKGMPFKYYHGRTGVVFNVTKRAIGVRVNKEVRKK